MRQRASGRARGALVVLLLVGAFGLTASPGEAGCVTPMTSIDIRRAAPGDVIEVTGQYWAVGCDDTSSCSTTGCGERCTVGEPSPPDTDISIELVPRGSTRGSPRILAEGVASDEEFEFAIDVMRPEDLSPGRYEIVAGSPSSGDWPSEPFRVAG